MTDAFGTASFAYDADQQLTVATDQAGGITRMDLRRSRPAGVI